MLARIYSRKGNAGDKLKTLLWVTKYVAIAFGIKEIINFLVFRIYLPADADTFWAVSDTSGVIGVLFAILYFWMERSEMVRKAPNRKSKLKRILLILITLGIIILIYKKAKREALI